MERLKKLSRQLSGRLRSMNPRSRLAVGAMLFLVLAAAVWLVASAGEAETTRLDIPSLAEEDLPEALGLLESRGIAARIADGALVVRSDSADAARAALRDEGFLSTQRRSPFEEVADSSDIWSTRSTTEKRWQAAKMATLQRLIEDFPAVCSATVILEPGSGRSLGGERPRAAVNVRLDEGATMTGELVGAIADLVAGSVSGMERTDVRVVDSRGVSHVAGRADSNDPLTVLKRAEGYYRERIASALRYIDDAIITVDVRGEDGEVACHGAAVSLPRSHLHRIAEAAGPRLSRDEVSQSELEDVRLRVAKVVGVPAESVYVDWYHDATSATTTGRGAPVADEDASTVERAAVVVVLLGLAAIAAGVAAWRRVAGRPRRPEQAEEETQATVRSEESAEEPFAFCCETPIEELQACLRGEHPQTVAVVLSYLPPARSAAILSSLEPDRRVEVVRRIAATREVDPQMLSEVATSLRRRLSRKEPQSPGVGVAAAAGILKHVGGAAEQAVLDALKGEAPDLAESLQRELMAFDDLERFPLEQWSDALESLDSEDLAVALRTANRRLRRRVLSSVSTATSRHVREQMERIGPVRLSDVEAAQQRVVEAVRRYQPGEYSVEAPSRESEAPAVIETDRPGVVSESS
ncbi:MAG: FliG C-terminal domain-containing protein [Phycisphaerae bacterium]